MQSAQIRIGTRGSPLALAQAKLVAREIGRINDLGDDDIAVRVIRTTGDAVQDRPLAEIGGKGLFTKEIESELLSGAIDLAVHSMKDVATVLPDGLEIAAVLEREDPRDALIARKAGSIAELPRAAVVGTSSLRRAALIRAVRPDLRVVGFRGNVETRLKKLEAGEVDATLLAVAGLRRLGLAEVGAVPIAIEEMLPAVAQGAIGVEIRRQDERTRALVEPLNHHETAVAVAAERAFLGALEGSCRTPIAAMALTEQGGLAFRGLIARPDGSVVHRVERRGRASDAVLLGADAGRELKDRGGPDFFAV